MLRKKSQIFALVISLLMFSAPGHSIDKNGNYHFYGNASCGEWVLMRREKSATIDQLRMVSWISGYITAFNSITSDTFNIAGDTGLATIFLWLDNYCQANPLMKLTDGLLVLTIELWPNRKVIGE